MCRVVSCRVVSCRVVSCRVTCLVSSKVFAAWLLFDEVFRSQASHLQYYCGVSEFPHIAGPVSAAVQLRHTYNSLSSTILALHLPVDDCRIFSLPLPLDHDHGSQGSILTYFEYRYSSVCTVCVLKYCIGTGSCSYITVPVSALPRSVPVARGELLL